MSDSDLCALCGAPGPLMNSHILPEFVYKPTYDDSHSAVEIDLDKRRRGKRRKGFRQYLLCKPCEGKLSKWESYFANIWLNPSQRLRPPVIATQIVQIGGLDYATFKLFHLSIIWRSGISTHEAFRNVELGGQEPKIRRRLLESDPGAPTDYPFFGIALRDPKTDGFLDAVIKGPDAARVGGHWVYTFLFGGVLWHYYVSGHESGRQIPVHFGKDGILTLGVQNWDENVVIRDFAARLQQAGL